MGKNSIIRALRINYVAALVAALAVLLAFECGWLAKGVLLETVSSTSIYVAQVAVVMCTVVLIPLAIKGFTRALVKAKGMPEDAFLVVFCKKSLQRIFLLFVVIVLNEFAYYGLAYEGALYCGLLGLGAMIYSYPTKNVLEQYLNDTENNL